MIASYLGLIPLQTAPFFWLFLIVCLFYALWCARRINIDSTKNISCFLNRVKPSWSRGWSSHRFSFLIKVHYSSTNKKKRGLERLCTYGHTKYINDRKLPWKVKDKLTLKRAEEMYSHTRAAQPHLTWATPIKFIISHNPPTYKYCTAWNYSLCSNYCNSIHAAALLFLFLVYSLFRMVI